MATVGLCAALALTGTCAHARTLSEIQALAAVSACLNPDALPYSSNDPQTPGFQLEIARAIADGLGVRLQVEWILPRRRAGVVNCDLLLDSVNDASLHEGRLLLSRPYQTSGVALGLSARATPIRDYRELAPGQKVGVIVNSVASVVLGKARKTISPYAFQADLIDDLRKGRLYAGAISAASLSYYILQHPDAGLHLAYAFDSEPDLRWQVSVGLRQSDQALVDAVNAILERLIADGTLTQIYRRYGVEHRVP